MPAPESSSNQQQESYTRREVAKNLALSKMNCIDQRSQFRAGQ
jgi:hypothetical protein